MSYLFVQKLCDIYIYNTLILIEVLKVTKLIIKLIYSKSTTIPCIKFLKKSPAYVNMENLKLLLWSALMVKLHAVSCAKQPHIVFIIADDMGWNDVSYHGSDQILTPNIDMLAYSGVVLQQYYSEPICTPARSALLTGKYPERLGMQGTPLYSSEDRAIPSNETLLPQYLKNLGYATHLVGKWHVGMAREEYLPTNRGFDSHYGIRGGFVDYYTHNLIEAWPNGKEIFGLDFFENMKELNTTSGYLTDLLTDRAVQLINEHDDTRPLFVQLAHGAPHAGNAGAPLQPPPAPDPHTDHIAYSDRRLYAEMVGSVDRSVGRVVEALGKRDMLHNTLVVFVSDNGAPSVGMYANYGLNLPHRGIKGTPWEGGLRVPAILYHSSLKPNVWNGLMHITDWLPTLVSAAGGRTSGIRLDGVDQWQHIATNRHSEREEVLLTVDDTKNFAAYRLGDYKVVVGSVPSDRSGYYGQRWMINRADPPLYMPVLRASEVGLTMEKLGRVLEEDHVKRTRDASTVKQWDPVVDTVLCIPDKTKGCLFNVVKDPMERHDLWGQATQIAKRLVERLRTFWSSRKARTETVLFEQATDHFAFLPWLRGGQAYDLNATYVAWQPNGDNPFPKTIGSAFLNMTCLRLHYYFNSTRPRDWTAKKMNPAFLEPCIQYS